MKESEVKPIPTKLDEEPIGPGNWERVLWSIGCGVLGFGISALLAVLFWGIRWMIEVGFGAPGFVLQFWGAIVMGGIGLICGAIWPGRKGLASVFIAHTLWAVIVAFLVFQTSDAWFYIFHYSAAALLFGTIAMVLVRGENSRALDEFRGFTEHLEPGSEVVGLNDNGPRWWHRALWGLGCGLSALVVGFLQFLAFSFGAHCFGVNLILGAPGFTIGMILILLTMGVAVVGLVIGAIYPGAKSIGVTLAIHAVCTAPFAALLLIAVHQEVRILSPVLFAAALVSGPIALPLLRKRAPEREEDGAAKE